MSGAFPRCLSAGGGAADEGGDTLRHADARVVERWERALSQRILALAEGDRLDDEGSAASVATVGGATGEGGEEDE